jgi:regulator of ribonuclease activity A
MLSTCELYDQHLEAIGTLPPALRHFGARAAFFGSVETVKCFEDNSRVKQLAESSGHGRVMVVDAGASVRHALVGDLVAKAAMDNGWAGIVLWGAVRDVAALRALDIGVMAIAATPRKSVRNGEGQVGIDIRIGDVRVSPGDFLVADEDGALVFPKGLPAPL